MKLMKIKNNKIKLNIGFLKNNHGFLELYLILSILRIYFDKYLILKILLIICNEYKGLKILKNYLLFLNKFRKNIYKILFR